MARPSAPANVAAVPAKPPTSGAPHPARRTVVLRPGPPPRKKGWADVLVGVVGAIVLVASGVLAFTLPDETVLPPQYKVSFVDMSGELPTQTLQFNTSSQAAQNQDFLFNVTHDQVTHIHVNVRFVDDLAASDPDQFLVELLDPDGNPVAGAQLIVNDPPRRNETFPSQFTPIPKSQSLSFPLRQKPQDTVVEGAFNSTADAIAQEKAAEHRFKTSGTWRLNVHLYVAGDCPRPTAGNPSPDEAVRGAACVHANSASPEPLEDGRNAFTVESFSYDYFGVAAERLD